MKFPFMKFQKFKNALANWIHEGKCEYTLIYAEKMRKEKWTTNNSRWQICANLAIFRLAFDLVSIVQSKNELLSELSIVQSKNELLSGWRSQKMAGHVDEKKNKAELKRFFKKKTWFTVISVIFDAELDFSRRNRFLAFGKYDNGIANAHFVKLFSLVLLMYGFDTNSLKPALVVCLLCYIFISVSFALNWQQCTGVWMRYERLFSQFTILFTVKWSYNF